ncbi:family membrane [Micractinium conductrix]|uniref:Family membrane n=1 Tax=Micractinium conductrix TaxID=554055 RepID=A0A2P6VG08_9CHLO|nr:family membrane [Micractinium conductrix]|eukprot:PSC73023.1 family membrane [Micractinium conductrix]
MATLCRLAAAQAAAGSAAGGLSGFLKSALSFVLHLDVHLAEIIAQYGVKTYYILFAIVFAETGLVVTPFLPGDSLLFATGALAALGSLNLPLLVGCYVAAATLGDAVNYAIGNYLGAAAFKSRLLKREHLAKTEQFYNKYGGKTVVLARFVPIVRTFAPFVAGVGSMSYGQFAVYNVAGAVLWTAVCVGAGFAFGNVPAVHENFSLVVLGIVLVSLLPIVWEMWQAKREGAAAAAATAAAPPRSVPHSTPAAAAAAVAATALPPQPPAVASAAAAAADKAKEKLAAAAAADPLEQQRVAECEQDPSSPDCRVYDD